MSSKSMKIASPPIKSGLGSTALAEPIVHSVTQDAQGRCCTRMVCVPLDATGHGQMHIDADTMMQTIASTNPDLHNMKGLEVIDSKVSGMSGPCGVSFMFGEGDDAIPFDTVSRVVSHAPTRADMWHHIATTPSQKSMEPHKIMLDSGFATKEQQSVAAATASWPDVHLTDSPAVTDVGDTHKMYPVSNPPTLAAVVLEKNVGNAHFLDGAFSADNIAHPVTGAEMRVVKNEHYNTAAELATEARAVKHNLKHGLSVMVSPIHESISPLEDHTPTATIMFRTLHDTAEDCNIVAQTGSSLDATSLKHVVTGETATKMDKPKAMTPAALAEHVQNTLKLNGEN